MKIKQKTRADVTAEDIYDIPEEDIREMIKDCIADLPDTFSVQEVKDYIASRLWEYESKKEILDEDVFEIDTAIPNEELNNLINEEIQNEIQ